MCIVQAETEPVIVEDLKITKTSADSLTVSWRSNVENSTSYSIEWFKKNELAGNASEIFSSADEMKYTIKMLESCTTYNVTVRAQPIFDIESIGKWVIGETALTRKLYILKLNSTA